MNCRLSCPILDEKEATKEEEPSKTLQRVKYQFPTNFVLSKTNKHEAEEAEEAAEADETTSHATIATNILTKNQARLRLTTRKNL